MITGNKHEGLLLNGKVPVERHNFFIASIMVWRVRCPNGIIAPEEILCLSTNEWSPLPLCNFRLQCADQNLSAQIQFIKNSCKKSTAPRCKVGCDVQIFSRVSNSIIHQLVFVKDAECNSSGLWQGLPDCEKAKRMFSIEIPEKLRCPKPKLPKNSVLLRKCLPTEGSVCHYKCKKGFFSSGNNTMRCFMKQWIGESKCTPILCPPLPKTFRYGSICGRIIGSNCDLQCKMVLWKGIVELVATCPENGPHFQPALPLLQSAPEKYLLI
ncbi:uncharacterized protein TNIN_235191 [Trichonephila inaurata madagascariensis]|uniref:Sushi domain-containing protein n=1 Tax=Trichonephila inaurata madagascariensis TaxID=2747483 RepID=A0A8X6YXD5_9ARAC|nr:uncharacterized protein TNIN_235191 [Trichonephila inaurata madagascariensis]